jgi:hypothetical protein
VKAEGRAAGSTPLRAAGARARAGPGLSCRRQPATATGPAAFGESPEEALVFTLLLALGGALVVFGAVVLLRYSDRPGGTLKWQGVEVSSSGAGLPLIALGIACVVFAIVRRPAPAAPPTGPPGSPGDSTAGDSSDCLKVRALPADRVDTVEAGMRDVELIGSHERLEPPFGVVLTDGGQPVGAIRLRRFAASGSAADLYKIEAVVDAACRPVGALRNTSRGGDPRALLNWDTVRLRFDGREYDLRIGGEGAIGVGRFARVS